MNSNKKTVDLSPADTIINGNSDFSVVEAYKSIRTNIMYSMPRTEGENGKKCGKVVVLTSASAGEGKTTSCINLAITFAQMNARVLLIDCDLRKPKVHRYLRLEKKDGLSNILCGFTSLENGIKVNVRENLDVITSGETPPNPTELLESKAFEKCIEVLKKVYDYIIIDTPPIAVVTDAAGPIKCADGTLLLIKKNYTTFEMVDVALDKLKQIGANILGTVMIDSKDGSYGSYQRKYKYGYRYGNNGAESGRK